VLGALWLGEWGAARFPPPPRRVRCAHILIGKIDTYTYTL
jgi:hypothetical protein